MSIKTKGGKYQCFYCLKEYNRPEKADSCREEHDIVYVPLARTDVSKLLNYLFIPDPEILVGTRIAEFLQRALKTREKKTHT